MEMVVVFYKTLCVLLIVIGFLIILGSVDSIEYTISEMMLYSCVGFFGMGSGIFLYNIADDRSSSFNDPEEESDDESDSFDQD
jgi:predicted tellurium resistance membrane protein TerC